MHCGLHIVLFITVLLIMQFIIILFVPEIFTAGLTGFKMIMVFGCEY